MSDIYAPDTPLPRPSLSATTIARGFAATLERGDHVHADGGRVWAEVHNGERTVTICEGLSDEDAREFARRIEEARDA